MKFKLAMLALPILAFLPLILFWGESHHATAYQLLQPEPTPPPDVMQPGPFANIGQLVLAVLMVAQAIFNSWWTTYQRGKTEERQAQLLVAANKLQDEREAREALARERAIERERQWMIEDRREAERKAEQNLQQARMELLNHTAIIERKIDENTRATTDTLDAANHLTDKVARAGALRQSDLEELRGLRRRKADSEKREDEE
jgi:hypothetical protein